MIIHPAYLEIRLAHDRVLEKAGYVKPDGSSMVFTSDVYVDKLFEESSWFPVIANAYSSAIGLLLSCRSKGVDISDAHIRISVAHFNGSGSVFQIYVNRGEHWAVKSSVNFGGYEVPADDSVSRMLMGLRLNATLQGGPLCFPQAEKA